MDRRERRLIWLSTGGAALVALLYGSIGYWLGVHALAAALLLTVMVGCVVVLFRAFGPVHDVDDEYQVSEETRRRL